MELASLEIEAVIVHEVPARLVRGGSPPPRLSDIESPLDDELSVFIADRMRDTLHTKGIDVRFADGALRRAALRGGRRSRSAGSGSFDPNAGHKSAIQDDQTPP